jgi:hypothetical protein
LNKSGKAREESAQFKVLEVNRDRLLDLIWYVEDCPKEKEEEELTDLVEEIQAGKLATLRLTKELLNSKDQEVVNGSYGVAQEVNKAVSRRQGEVSRLQRRMELPLD